MAAPSQEKNSTNMITLQYSGATVAALISTFGILLTLSELFGLWTDKAGGVWILSGYVGVVSMAVTAALFSVVSFLLYRRVTKQVAERTDYIATSAYNFITNAFFAVLAGVLIVIVASLVAVLIASLLLIGTSTDIGGLYLGEFLPGLLAGLIVAFVGFCAYKIMKGKNFSLPMTLVLMSLAGALFLAVLITVPIKAHMTPTAWNSGIEYNSSLYDDLYNGTNR